MTSTDKKRIVIQGRSDGDGMENASFTENGKHDGNTTADYHYKNFIPSSGKQKGPKFVPYEPYKAAVSPIIPSAKKCEKPGFTKYVIDSQKVSSLVSNVIKLNSKKTDCFSENINDSIQGEKNICNLNCKEKINTLEEKINKLMEEKKELEKQFKIQAEVNADLKKMLIASLGEDMQLKVQYMTEDKARLGMNALQFFEELNVKSEEIEKLSIQCDVWKSKFEASSVMVDELAGWKVALSKKLGEAIWVLNSLLKEHEIIIGELCSTENILKHIQGSFNPRCYALKDGSCPENLINLAKGIHNLSNIIQERLLGKSCITTNSNNLYQTSKQLTPAERSALQILSDFDDLPLLMKFENDKGVVHHSPGTVACQVLPHVCAKDPTLNCCKHCSGDIKLI